MSKAESDENIAVASITAAAMEVRNRRASKWLRRAGMLALGAVGSALALGAASLPLSGMLIRPRLKRLSHLKRPHLRRLLERIEIRFEDVMIPSFDALRLHGWWMGSSKDSATVVVIHGVKKNRTDVLRAAVALRRAGFNVLVFDGRAHGNSEGRYVTYGYYERRDVETAIQWLIDERGIDADRIGLAGESMGAAIALQVAAESPFVRAVWADSPFASLRRVTEEFASRVTRLPQVVLSPVLWTTIRMANYRGKFNVESVDPLKHADQIKCPVFLVHGTEDQVIAANHSRDIHSALLGDKEIWIVEGGTHARSIRHQLTKREYIERLVRFFSEKLKPRIPVEEKHPSESSEHGAA
ncbi:MAG TPA: alpha/beta fold hydrolase [Blastocatellia bacterium]|nr:alpha/beta fold hydrolase [Blastocatellia bacterium]